MGQLLDAERERDVDLAGRDLLPCEMERRRRRRARVLHVEDRHATDAALAQHYLTADALLAGDQTRDRVAHHGELHVARLESDVDQRLVHGLARQALESPLRELAEVGHPHAGDNDRVATHDGLLVRPGCERTDRGARRSRDQ